MGKYNIEFLSKHLDIKRYPNGVETGTFQGHSTIIMSQVHQRVFTIELNRELYEKTAMELKTIDNIKCVFGDSAQEIKNLVNWLKEPTIFFLDAHWSGDETVNWQKSNWFGFRNGHWEQNKGFVDGKTGQVVGKYLDLPIIPTSHLGQTSEKEHEKEKEKEKERETLPKPNEQNVLDQEILYIYQYFKPACVLYIDDMDKFSQDGSGMKNKGFHGEDWSHINIKKIEEQIKDRIVYTANRYLDNGEIDQRIIVLREMSD